jgi:uncharacterized protein (DUF2141 family)
MLVRCAGFALGSLLLGSLAGKAWAADLTITVDGLRNNNGQVLLCIFDAKSSDTASFPDCDKGRPVRSLKAPIAGGKVIVTYNGLAPGTYGVAMIHDENFDGKLATNFIGIPTDGFGVSNNPTLYRAPRFSDAQFSLGEGKAAITVTAKYLL